MKTEHEILINKFGQGLINIEPLKTIFSELNFDEKRFFLKEIIYYFIQQSKAVNSDISKAIKQSLLKPTYTPCVMVRKGVDVSNLEKIVKLPEKELEKVLVLFLSIFKIAYQRRFLLEKDNTDKWWYLDMSDEIIRFNKNSLDNSLLKKTEKRQTNS